MMKRGEIRSILAATDLGAASDEVVRAAAGLAERTGARLHLINALEIERLPGMENPTYPTSCSPTRRGAWQGRRSWRA
jgi:hypothetical protein